jgi:Asp-tRNA(Asn)/Glu-tRNA(Gln) amidotransferase A subunit family amidase
MLEDPVNPYALTKSAGGSSGGATSALAAPDEPMRRARLAGDWQGSCQSFLDWQVTSRSRDRGVHTHP